MFTDQEKSTCDNILRSLVYYNYSNLKKKLINIKSKFTEEKYNILVFGNSNLYDSSCNLENKEMYKIIKELDNRWCLQSILYYHLTKLNKLTKTDYDEILCA
tara:strand:- start:96 stop:401 length:306 start_codon:yes stop_codon:yes gene_type:complete